MAHHPVSTSPPPHATQPELRDAAGSDVLPSGALAAAPELAAGSMLGGYRIERVLGTGGMGAVYLATDTHLGRQVAVKTMRPDVAADPQVRERFLREARAAASIEHEHVVPVYAVGDAGGSPYLVMPLLRGEALDTRLQRGAWPSLVEACRLAREVAAGLAAAHAAGVVHRDVKPSNVWLDEPTGRARLLDFGLARPARGGEVLTRAGTVVGTPAYMAPEQAAGGAVDHRADLFGLGVLLYELTTRRRPFVGDSVLAVLTALAVHDPRPAHEANPEVPVVLSRLIGRLLAKNRFGRPATAAEVVGALAAVETALPVTSRWPSGPSDRTPLPAERRSCTGGPVEKWGRVHSTSVLLFGGGSALTSACALVGLGAVWVWVALSAGVAALALSAVGSGRQVRTRRRARRGVRCGLGLAVFGLVLAVVLLCVGTR